MFCLKSRSSFGKLFVESSMLLRVGIKFGSVMLGLRVRALFVLSQKIVTIFYLLMILRSCCGAVVGGLHLVSLSYYFLSVLCLGSCGVFSGLALLQSFGLSG